MSTNSGSGGRELSRPPLCEAALPCSTLRHSDETHYGRWEGPRSTAVAAQGARHNRGIQHLREIDHRKLGRTAVREQRSRVAAIRTLIRGHGGGIEAV